MSKTRGALGIEGLTEVDTETIIFSAARAREFLGHRRYSWMNNLSSSKVRAIDTAMREGSFTIRRQQLCICELEGEMILVNGLHSSTALLEDPNRKYPGAQLEIYRADSEEAVQALWRTFDRGASRRKSDLHYASLQMVPDFAGKPRRLLEALVGGFKLYHWVEQKERGNASAETVEGLIAGDYLDLAVEIASFLQELLDGDDPWSDVQYMFRTPVVAAMFATFEQPKTHVEGFWIPISQGDDMGRRSDPRHRLYDILLSKELPVKRGESANSELWLRYILMCWNAHRAGNVIGTTKPTKEGDRPAVK